MTRFCTRNIPTLCGGAVLIVFCQYGWKLFCRRIQTRLLVGTAFVSHIQTRFPLTITFASLSFRAPTLPPYRALCSALPLCHCLFFFFFFLPSSALSPSFAIRSAFETTSLTSLSLWHFNFSFCGFAFAATTTTSKCFCGHPHRL